jgi:5-formyltetrahydrofolate cyclo-ligase
MHSDDELGGTSPCYAVIDAQQARDVARWRKSERERLIALRMQMSAGERAAQTEAIAAELDRLIPRAGTPIVSVYWPIRGEPDLRPWMRAQAARGLRIALPLAAALGQPMTFREWRPGAPMARGLWKIPYPADGEEVTPTVVLAPLVGYDGLRYRLGYGGGFFDRTLAGLKPRPLIVGLGYACTAINTIFPQPHDIPMDLIVTGTVQEGRTEAHPGGT